MDAEVLECGDVSLDVWASRSDASGKGQDRYRIASCFLGVADGATPLAEEWPSNVGEFAETGLRNLAKLCTDPVMPVNEVWRRAIAATAAQHRLREPELSAGVAIARIVGEYLEFAAIGDCEAVVRRTTGEYLRLHDGRLQELDALAMNAPDAASEYRRMLQTRRAMNSAGGYWIFAGNPDAADHIVTRRLRADEVSAFLLYSDGFYRLVEPYHIAASVSELLDLVATRKPEELIALLRKHESEVLANSPEVSKSEPHRARRRDGCVRPGTRVASRRLAFGPVLGRFGEQVPHPALRSGEELLPRPDGVELIPLGRADTPITELENGRARQRGDHRRVGRHDRLRSLGADRVEYHQQGKARLERQSRLWLVEEVHAPLGESMP